jgi:hypothetical protein
MLPRPYTTRTTPALQQPNPWLTAVNSLIDLPSLLNRLRTTHLPQRLPRRRPQLKRRHHQPQRQVWHLHHHHLPPQPRAPLLRLRHLLRRPKNHRPRRQHLLPQHLRSRKPKSRLQAAAVAALVAAVVAPMANALKAAHAQVTLHSIRPALALAVSLPMAPLMMLSLFPWV